VLQCNVKCEECDIEAVMIILITGFAIMTNDSCLSLYVKFVIIQRTKHFAMGL